MTLRIGHTETNFRRRFVDCENWKASTFSIFCFLAFRGEFVIVLTCLCSIRMCLCYSATVTNNS
jgi:hypothetical protein